MADLTPWADEFDPQGIHLNTASMGLPPRRTIAAVGEQLGHWTRGTFAMSGYEAAMEAARGQFARLTGLAEESVFLGSQTSVLVGLIAASVPDGCEVLIAEGDYASLALPLLAQVPRISIRTVPLASLADHIGPRTQLVAASAVQSADGAVIDLPEVEAAAHEHGAEILLDITQSAGWLPLDLSGVGYTACSAYKWLMSPRGTAFGSVRTDLLDTVRPLHPTAGTQDGALNFYPTQHNPATTARRFDVSPAWPAWAGAVPSLGLLTDIGVERVHAHDTGLANACADGLGLPHPDSAILAIAVGEGAAEAVAAAGISAAVRSGRLRLAFHLHNSSGDVDRVAEVLAPHVQR